MGAPPCLSRGRATRMEMGSTPSSVSRLRSSCQAKRSRAIVAWRAPGLRAAMRSVRRVIRGRPALAIHREVGATPPKRFGGGTAGADRVVRSQHLRQGTGHDVEPFPYPALRREEGGQGLTPAHGRNLAAAE